MRRRLHSETSLVLPTNTELLILDVLWELGEGTVQNIADRLQSTHRANYKTVQSLLRIMENKGLAEHKTRGRAFVYFTRVSRDEIGRISAKRLLERNFQGSYTAMLVNLLDSSHVKEQELDELEALIRRYRQQRAKDD